MKYAYTLAAAAIFGLSSASRVDAATASADSLREVYHNDHFQLTGITISKSNRRFVNYPRWSDSYRNAVEEILPDGSARPFPNDAWNRWDLKSETAASHFVCVQSVVVDDTDILWVVDAGAPLLTSPVPNGPKLVAIDLRTNSVRRVIPLKAPIIKANTYLNDIRIDTTRQVAYLTDSGAGGIVVVDFGTNLVHRALDNDPSVMPEPGVDVVVNGKPLLQNGKPPQFHSDGIALDRAGSYLYYKPITSTHLYRIPTSVLRNTGATTADTHAAVENLGYAPPADGLWIDRHDMLYLTDPTHNAVTARISPGQYRQVVTDPRLQWPDTISESPSGELYVTTSRINESAPFNNGISVRSGLYAVFTFSGVNKRK